MPRAPSIVPDAIDRDIYLVLDDFGTLGRSWRETDEAETDRETVITSLMDGQYSAPCSGHSVQHRRRPVARRIQRFGGRNLPPLHNGRFRCSAITDGFRGSSRHRPAGAIAATTAPRGLVSSTEATTRVRPQSRPSLLRSSLRCVRSAFAPFRKAASAPEGTEAVEACLARGKNTGHPSLSDAKAPRTLIGESRHRKIRNMTAGELICPA